MGLQILQDRVFFIPLPLFVSAYLPFFFPSRGALLAAHALRGIQASTADSDEAVSH